MVIVMAEQEKTLDIHSNETNVNEEKCVSNKSDTNTTGISVDSKDTSNQNLVETNSDKATNQISESVPSEPVICEIDKLIENKEGEKTIKANNNDNRNELKAKATMEDDDGEDLPENFFDDFSNTDFMAGLDIVDDWIDENGEIEKSNLVDDHVQQPSDAVRRKITDKNIHGKKEVLHRSKREPSPRRRHVSPRKLDDRRYRDRYRDRSRSRDRYERRRSRERELNRRSRERELNRRSRERELNRSSRDRKHDRSRDDRRSRERFRSRERNRSNERKRSKPKDPAKSKEPSKPDDPLNSKDQLKKDEKERVPLKLDSRNSEDRSGRRDPEKTKRDIQRDKVRCAKDFEARVFQEQLKVAETGLVPPGEELDVVLEKQKQIEYEKQKQVELEKQQQIELEKQKQIEHDKLINEKKEELSSLRHRRYSSGKTKSRSPRRHSTNERRISPEYSKKKAYVHSHRSRERSLSSSPRTRRRSRSRSAARSIDRLEELYRRNDDLRLRIREKRREKYINELSPVSETHFDRSPSRDSLSIISNISERELWLRNREREKYKHRYSRSCSPVSSSSLSPSGSPKRKRSRGLSFMEEIQQKLREKSNVAHLINTGGNPFGNHQEPPRPVPPPLMNITFPPNQPFMAPPTMVPNPYQQPQQPPQPVMMSQQAPMMMGPPMGVPPQNYSGGGQMGLMMQGQGLLGPPPQNMLSSPMVMNLQSPTMVMSPEDMNPYRTPSNLKACVSSTNTEVTKLFEEQKISLSDYLSVSAKPIENTTSPVNVHKKIKVISKCQEVMKMLNDESKFSGRFFPKLTPQSDKAPEAPIKWKSPLRKMYPVRYAFTTPNKNAKCDEPVKIILNKLLTACDISYLPDKSSLLAAKKPLHTSIQSVPKINTFIPSTPTPPTPPIIPPPSVLIHKSTIGVQTDPIKCQICEIRSARKFSDHGCQTQQTVLLDQATQVFMEDLTKSCTTFTPRGILKTSTSSSQSMSISHMTPAQLLALQQEQSSDREKDNWSGARNETFPISRNLPDRYSASSSYGSSFGNSSNSFYVDKTPFSVTGSLNSASEKIPFQNKNFMGSMGGFQGDMMGMRAPDRYMGNDRYSPENFSDSPYTNRNVNVRGRGGNSRGFPGNSGFNGPNRPFFD